MPPAKRGPITSPGPFGEATEVMRIPKSAKPVVRSYLEALKRNKKPGQGLSQPEKLLPDAEAKMDLSVFQRAVEDPVPQSISGYSWKILAGETTGFKSPAQDYEQEELDLNKRYVVNRPATYFFTVGKHYDSMVDAKIFPDSTVIVDCSVTPKHNSIVVAAVDDEWVVKRLYKRGGKIKLLSENKEKDYSPIEFEDGQELRIFGVVRTAINDIF